jgi:amidase
MDPQSLEITSLPAHEIATKIAQGELTAVQTLQAFIKRATLAHQLTNCAMELLFEEGLQRARDLDQYQSTHGTTCGPLHGVPISLKEHFDYPNHITHRGYVSLLDRIPNKFATSSQILYDLGAVFYIRTTEPQSLMHPDSWNNITGRGRNALKTTLSPGGSSSGEVSLIAMRGSPLGLGSDIGGSVRFPAAFNGIWSLRPSTKRISKIGCGGAADGFYSDGVLGVLGPMAHSPEDLDFFMKPYLSREPWLLDQQLVPLPWRSVPEVDQIIPQLPYITMTVLLSLILQLFVPWKKLRRS